MSGSIIKREGKRGLAWLLKYDAPRADGAPRRQLYKWVKGARKDAERELRALLGQIDDGTHIDPNKVTVAEWIETWLRDHAAPRTAAKTHERYSELFRLHVAPRIGGTRLLKLTPPTIQALYAELRSGEGKRALSGQTILHVHRQLKQALKAAVRQRIIPRNPADDVDTPRRDAQADKADAIRALEQKQLDALLLGFKDHSLFPIVVTAAGTGMRRGELLALRWSDIDFERLTIRVERSVEDTKAKGIRIKPPKTRSSRRTIGIDPGLAAMLKVELARHAEIAIQCGLTKEQRIDALAFPSSPATPAVPRHPRGVTKSFARQTADLGFAIRLHDLRHTHATLLLTAGVPLNAVSQRLGHASPSITLNVYGHVLRKAEDQAVAVAGSLLASALAGNQA